MKTISLCSRLAAAVLMAAVFSTCAYTKGDRSASGEELSKNDRKMARDMFKSISNDVKRYYYDPAFHGLDWSATVAATERAIDESANLNRALSEIAAGLDKLADSHTFFIPPPRPYTHEFGWRLEMLGDRCFVTEVRPQSDAERQGIRRGDEVLALNGFQPTRRSLPKMMYVFHALRPQPALRIAARSPEGQAKELDIHAAIQRRKKVLHLPSDFWDVVREAEQTAHLERARWAEISSEVVVLKFPLFNLSEIDLHAMMNKARKYKGLVIDLRGNPGGSEETLQELLGEVVDHDVRVGNRLTREGSKPLQVKSKGKKAFNGKLVVLVDSGSASASEVFSRVMQLEKRAMVLGDKTAGAVMEAKHFTYSSGVGTMVFYGASITEADILMTDGKSLEHAGVVPDELILPTAADLEAGRDPVIVRAAQLCGVTISPEVAGGLFPYEWE